MLRVDLCIVDFITSEHIPTSYKRETLNRLLPVECAAVCFSDDAYSILVNMYI